MGVRSLELQIVVSAVRAEVVVHRVVVRVEHRSERVGAIRLPVRASVGADVPVLRPAFAEMLLVLAEVRMNCAAFVKSKLVLF